MNKMVQIENKETGRVITLLDDDYELVAAYVRERDRIDYAVDVLNTTNTWLDHDKVLNNEKLLSEFAIFLDNEMNNNWGEREYDAIISFFERKGLCWPMCI